ncbi:peptide chain release factor N(5)-glutamine methyltransferase [Xanthobacter autotrophicus]|uniref:peptide chain release factor N(5)-glutamine methyltransferase n=1 Tax=Xanthobacter TaxID=279 RepID=UPI0024ABE711|nr:peptide chain release factor N(5)-glutamine methyltransferase [Xanthobacter autotrophicus]MDI4663872.1 peptide chain release factor N(5)-glutamine methyltransferase [Xanthobacter autotrophicus]
MADTLTIGALRRQMAAALAAAGVETPDLDARLLLAHALGYAPGDLLLRADAVVPPEAATMARAFAGRRAGGEPVARIRCRREFWSLDLHLSPDTLVPRPDTETVVEAALSALPDRDAPYTILDLGTGTGAILAALLVELANATGIGVDRAEGAAATARDNLARNGLAGRSLVVVGDWGAALAGGFDLVVSNPPYITTSAMTELPAEVRLHDPHLALEAGADGLLAYRAITADLPRLLRPGGVAVLELGAGQEPEVAALVAAAGLAVAGPARRDLSGVPRALVACRA